MLRESFAKATARQANRLINWEEIRSLKAKLIALNKLFGVRPVGIGESADRLFEKVMIIVTGDDVVDICGSDQLCSGVKAGIEGAVHAIQQTFQEQCGNGWGLLLSDGSNAFNSMSRPVFLWTVRILWPRCSTFLFNSYRGFAVLVIRGEQTHFLFSKEGCTQGSGLAMQAYAVGNLPLFQKLKNSTHWIQNWFADDGSCLGPLDNLIQWLRLLNNEGPRYGYYNEVNKNILIVAPEFVTSATKTFGELGVKVVTGHRVLGGFIGSEREKASWVTEKIDFWIEAVGKLSHIAKKDPQAAFIAISKSLQNEWTYLQRVLKSNEETFQSLKDVIALHFLPEICGFELHNFEADILLQPTRFGGVGIRDPVKTASSAYKSSYEASAVLRNAITTGGIIDIQDHNLHFRKMTTNIKREDEELTAQHTGSLLDKISIDFSNQITRIMSYKCSSWLSANPWEDSYFVMTPDEFRDSMACRYSKTPRNLQAWCDGCGKPFDVDHALDCKNGGLVYQRHNESRDENCDLNRKAGLSQVISEPIIQEADANGAGELRGDWSVRGFWVPQRVALFDTRIFNANAPSYKTLSLEAAFSIHRNEKKRRYCAAAEHRRASFTPIIATCEGIFDREADAYVKRLAFHLSKKWEKSLSQSIFWVRARLQMCILRSVSNCFRGSRTKWRGGNVEDGAAMPFISD